MDSNTISMMPEKKENRDNNFVVVCVIYLVVLLAFIFLRIASGLGWFDNFSDNEKTNEQISDLVFSILSQVVIMFLIPVVGMYIYRRKTAAKQQTMSFADFAESQRSGMRGQGVLKSWGFGNPGIKVIGWAILLGFLLYFFNMFVSGISNGILAIFGYRFPTSAGETAFSGVGGFFITLLLVAVLPGLCEETAHRGLLLRGFIPRLGVMRAVLFSSILFGLMHLNIVQCIYAAVLGYMMALAVMATRSIWTAVIIHFINNGIGVFTSFAQENGWFGGDFVSYVVSFFSSSFLVFLLCAVLLYMAVTAIIHKVARENFVRDRLHTEQGTPVVRLKGMAAIKFYLTADEPKERAPLRPIEKTMLFGVIFLGTVITIMTIAWGFL